MVGEIQNFTGASQQYESPERAEIHLLAGRQSPQVSAGDVLEQLVRRGVCEFDIFPAFDS